LGQKSKRKNKKHFPGKGKVTIHTGRTPKCCRGDKCQYKKTARSPSIPGGNQKIADLTLGKAQDHHIVPVSVLIAYRGDRQTRPEYEGYIRYIDDMYRDQSYCANNKANLMWLPTKATYAQNSTSPSSKVFDLNLPCHTWDHPRYTKDVLKRAKKLIWDEIKRHYTEEKPCPPADVVSVEFKNLEDEFSKRLTVKRNTRQAIDNAGKTAKWWVEFSMATRREASAKPAFSFGISAKVPASLLR
jgi:hypothetical protein